jgi:hypothetical protein
MAESASLRDVPCDDQARPKNVFSIANEAYRLLHIMLVRNFDSHKNLWFATVLPRCGVLGDFRAGADRRIG